MKRTSTIIFTLAFIFISFESLTYVSGPGGGYTNAPSESNCTSCHSGTLNAGGSLSNLKMDNNFTGGGYIPDSTYTLKVQMAQSGIKKYGFNITALSASDSSPTGDFTITSSRTQRRTKSISGKTRKYVEHTSGGTTASGTNSTEWEFEWTAPSSNIGKINYYVAVNAANGNGQTSGDDIYAKSFTIVPSSLLPEAEITSNDTIICSGGVAQFKQTATGITTYDWRFPSGSPGVSSDSAPKINYNFPGNQRAMLRIKNSKGWSGLDTFQIKVLQSPTAFISGNSVQKICRGGSIDLTAQFKAGNSYLWSTGATGNVLTATDTGTYFVIVKSGICEKASNSIKIEFYNDIKETLSSNNRNDSICSGEFVRLSTNTGYDSFFWYMEGKLIAKTDTNLFETQVDNSGGYTVRVLSSNGCLGSPSDTIGYIAIDQDSAPAVTCTNQTPFSVDFDWTGLKSHGGAQVSLNKGGTWITPSSGAAGNSHSLTGLDPEKNYEIWVRGRLLAPCFYTKVAKQVCRTGKCSPLEASVVADSMVCEGDELRIEINGLSTEKYSLVFEGGQPFTDTIFTFTPLVEKTYTVEVIDSAFPACPSKKLTFPVHIDKIELLQFYTEKPNNTFCENDTIKFTASSGNDIYKFYVNGVLRATTQDSFYYENQFNDGDSAFVEVSKGVCTETSEKILLNVVPTPDAKFTFSNVGSVYTFTPDNLNYQTYFWDFGDGDTSVIKAPDHSYKTSSNQKVTARLDVTDNSNCGASASQDIQLPDFSLIEALNADQLRIYPSPVNHILHIKWLSDKRPLTLVTITSLQGKELIRHKSASNTIVLDVASIPTGIYVLEIKSEEGFLIKRLLKL